MQLSQSLSVLLTGVLLSITLSVVEASPIARRTPDRLITLPLRRYEHARDVHPQIKLQQHINRGFRRLARMTGTAEPSARDLEQNLVKRVLSIEGPEGLERRINYRSLEDDNTTLEKRYNRLGVPKAAPGVGNSLVDAEKGSLAAQDSVTEAQDSGFKNSLGLDIEAQDTAYLATVQSGNPPRDFSILMDSGSADFWMGSENCTSLDGGGCGNHLFLGPQSSSSFVDTNVPFEVTYGTGSVQGTIIKDDITLAGLTLKAHTFGVADVESPEFSSNSVPFDGLMGLAQSTLSNQKVLTPPEALAKAGLVKEAIVSFKISRLEDNKNDGEITFGGLDPNKFDAKTLVTIPNANAKGFWEADVDDATVDGQSLGLQGRTAILDTGTTLAILPAKDAIAIHKLIPGAKSDGRGGFTVPCTTDTVVSFTFGGQAFDIDPRDIAFLPLDNADPEGDCASGITSGNVGGATEWLVGDTFLKNAYFSTNVQKNTISLAKLV